MAIPIRIHPQNPKLFEHRGRAIALLTATEHYGAVLNRPFDYVRYLEHAAEGGITLTRLFMLFREQQAPINPYSTCKPESPDYVSPFVRVGPGTALDGQPKYDLDQWNPEFFDRLSGFLTHAELLGIIAEVVLLSNTYGPDVWALNPLQARNNINGLPEIPWYDYMTRRHADVYERQVAHVRKIVSETHGFDNVIYEICNEPGGAFPAEGAPTQAEVNDWLESLAAELRATDAGGHLLAGQQAFCYDPWEQPTDLGMDSMDLDVINVHPLPNTTLRGEGYDMGVFMSKQLELRAFRDYCLATLSEAKPVNLDEDNVASQYKDPDGWTIHRKRAWVALLSGCHYDYIDFSIQCYLETGTPASRSHIRAWMGHLSRLFHSLDLASSRPLPQLVTECPEHCVPCVYGVDGSEIIVYLADEREQSVGVGSPLSGHVGLDLAQGQYRCEHFSPVAGLFSPGIQIEGGHARISVTGFVHDIALRLRRVESM